MHIIIDGDVIKRLRACRRLGLGFDVAPELITEMAKNESDEPFKYSELYVCPNIIKEMLDGKGKR